MAESPGREDSPHYPDHLTPYPSGPVPSAPSDPSFLTTEQLRRELASLLRLVETRLDAIEGTASQFREDLTRVPTTLQSSVEALSTLFDEKLKRHEGVTNEKFLGVQRQLDERDIRAKTAEISAQTGLSVAMTASEKSTTAQNESNATAMSKSEAAFVKQIDGILVLISSNTKTTDEKIATNAKTLDDKLNTIMPRIDRAEGNLAGAHANTTERRDGVGSIVGIVAVAIAVLAFVMNFVIHKP